MPRVARVAPKGYIYHILTRGNNRQNVFKAEGDFDHYLEILWKYKKEYRFLLYHYVLMRNHVHLVLELTRDGGSLAEIMKGINLSYVFYYKKKYKHIGHFWQDRYKSIIVAKNNYLLACGSYVELNPVRAQTHVDPGDYPWSSYSVYAYGKSHPLVDEHPIYGRLSSNELIRRKRYRDLVKRMMKERNGMKGVMFGRILYGNSNFEEKIREVHGIASSIRSRGRPKKDAKREK